LERSAIMEFGCLLDCFHRLNISALLFYEYAIWIVNHSPGIPQNFSSRRQRFGCSSDLARESPGQR
jgi:hypothetical protein